MFALVCAATVILKYLCRWNPEALHTLSEKS